MRMADALKVLDKRTANESTSDDISASASAVVPPSSALVPFRSTRKDRTPESSNVADKANLFEGEHVKEDKSSTLTNTHKITQIKRNLEERRVSRWMEFQIMQL